MKILYKMHLTDTLILASPDYMPKAKEYIKIGPWGVLEKTRISEDLIMLIKYIKSGLLYLTRNTLFSDQTLNSSVKL